MRCLLQGYQYPTEHAIWSYCWVPLTGIEISLQLPIVDIDVAGRLTQVGLGFTLKYWKLVFYGIGKDLLIPALSPSKAALSTVHIGDVRTRGIMGWGIRD